MERTTARQIFPEVSVEGGGVCDFGGVMRVDAGAAGFPSGGVGDFGDVMTERTRAGQMIPVALHAAILEAL